MFRRNGTRRVESGQSPDGVSRDTPQRSRIAPGLTPQGDKVSAFRLCFVS